ncbi:MAG: alpha/beta hydrolase [Zetaproteobacteria bacterium CG06_land_8_20_14_3_00_59_53]|nr:MAG: alpha/beta hydrolase [Zetaproteobacteria bacterium CG2_30_59_37]PIO89840.1 MAG: alpha/beta hydrolase [Zetaproteobacteria bacterium CG23_combo_of_CG06-09_8_20_14_all_59_86]PIQ64203.1 MAG: alpha/beta hydrolase [Zetaproteobacteria bacterium CG11_big_fil_rev_8_21_14_0_20_59_439]PIU70451.1 MAG: alpha/beta hydrolase [Zetaproteobacteria bacterium CG06_land_8_20_14_3_00_59_53]PIU97426.1 MAG: alpha/beta hydrolase [Zetaproteobacteria bacterium CG03_land_8_20_14_0_80_59_51]PIY46661.1 MAG: alpha/b
MQHKRIFLQGPAGRLQGLYRPFKEPVAAVVVCHPHPQFGGTMHNKVVYWMARAFESLDCSVLRFNFRGVDQSEGCWDEGAGEAEDAAVALDWMHAEHPHVPLWLAGFSFGAYAGLKAARQDARVERLFAVAPAVNLWDFSFMQGDVRPLTVVAGTLDNIVPYTAIAAATRLQRGAQLHTIADAGHFFDEHRKELAAALLADVIPSY